MDFEDVYKKRCEQLILSRRSPVMQDMYYAWKASAEAHKPRWISVSERLPDKDGHYPALRENKSYWGEEYFNGYEFEKYNVPHWLDIPELPDDE